LECCECELCSGLLDVVVVFMLTNQLAYASWEVAAAGCHWEGLLLRVYIIMGKLCQMKLLLPTYIWCLNG